MWVCNNP